MLFAPLFSGSGIYDSLTHSKRWDQNKQRAQLHLPVLMATTFTTTNVVLKHPNLSDNNAVSLGFHCPNPHHLSLLRPNLRTKLKLKSFSISRTTHLKVSQDSLTPTQESLSSSLQHDLLIVGPGVLGRLVAHKWQQVLSHSLCIQLICEVLWLWVFFIAIVIID
jgi:hypothetical protein